MKLIHTSDWHIGRTLYGRKRYQEFGQFLDWLAEKIEELDVDALLVAGDIFDNSTPSNLALQIYYRFLCRVANSSCRHVVITAGNHDSPSLLNAPKDVLQFLNVHVVGGVTDSLEDEVLLLRNSVGEPEIVVCAVPYLRDRDIRKAEAGESLDNKGQNLLKGIRDHYHAVIDVAAKQSAGLAVPVPIIAMGHLFTAGGKTVDGDGVRDLYVGSLAYVEGDSFPENIDYLALGHLHVAQKVSGAETRRYSGSPLAMSFGEARQEKSVCLVTIENLIENHMVHVDQIAVPCFQELETVRGDLVTIIGRIAALKAASKNIWLEVIYDGDEIIGGELQEQLSEALKDSEIEILRTKNQRLSERVLGRGESEETLDDLEVEDVFRRCLDGHEVPEAQCAELMATFNETVAMINEDDAQAD